MSEMKTAVNVSLPNAMIYAAPASRRSMITRRENVFRNADGTSSGITPNSVITFTLPPTNTLLVPQEVYFTMRVLTSANTADIRGNVQRLIQRVRIMNTNGEILEDISNFNLLNELIQDIYFSDAHQFDYLQPEGVYQKYGGSLVAADVENTYAYDETIQTSVPFTVAGSTLTAGVLTLAGAPVLNTGLVSVGDAISIRGNGIADGGVGTVDAVAAAAITVSGLPAAQNIADGDMRSVVIIKQKSTYLQDGVKTRLATGTGKIFSFQLRGSGLMMLDKYLPMQHMGGLRIEFTIENQNTAIVGTAGNESYTINDPRIYYTLLTPSDQLAATLSKAARAGKLNFTYSTFDNRQYSLTNTSDIAIELTKPLFRVNNVFAVRRDPAIVSSLTSDSFVLESANMFGTDGTVDSYYQFSHNSIYYPVDRVSSFERAYTEMVKSVGQVGDVTYAVPFRKYKSQFADSKFVIGQSFETMHEADMYSGSSTKNNKSIIFQGKLSANDSMRWDIFTHYVRNVAVQPGTGVVVSE